MAHGLDAGLEGPNPAQGREERRSSPCCRPHQSTKRTPSLYYRNSYETAPRKNPHIREKKSTNKATHRRGAGTSPRCTQSRATARRAPPPPLTQRGQTLLELGLRARGEGGGGGSSEALPGRRAQRRAAGPSYRATRALPNLVTRRGSSASDPSRPGQARPSASTVGWGGGKRCNGSVASPALSALHALIMSG